MIDRNTNIDTTTEALAFVKPMLSAAAVKLSKAKVRAIVFDKYNGKCAYCGCDLQKGWHVDHIQAIRRNDSDEWIEKMNKVRNTPLVRGQNSIENYNPACRQCNIWKSTYNIEQFRKEVAEQVKRLNDYSANYRNAKRYGLISENDIEVKFHFEKVFSNDR